MFRMQSKSTPADYFSRVAISLILLLSVIGQACSNRSSSSANPSRDRTSGELIPVITSRVVKKDIPIDIQAVGNVEASSSVTVRSQVSGELTRVFFKEGDFVKKGDELFNIDSRTYEAQLNQTQANLVKDEAVLAQAEANLAKDQAQQKYARAEALRYANLFEKHLVSREQMEQANANAESISAAVSADQAAIQSARANVEATRAAIANARVMLSYTNIRSPIDGRTGNLDVTPGNVISPNTVLMTINQIEPIYVGFSVPEVQFREVKKGQTVTVSMPDKSIPLMSGELFFIDNTVDETTGMVRLKAVFPNRDHRLWPGQFVQITLRIGKKPGALVIPNQALQSGQNNTFVFVVKPDQTVESRPVVPGLSIGQEVVIEKGLEVGEIVVTEGQLRLAIGSRVRFSGSIEP